MATLIKWIPVGIGGYLLIIFLFNQEWLKAAISLWLTLAWVGFKFNKLNNLSSNNQHCLTSKKSFNWDSVQVFEPSNSEHLYQAKLIIDLCNNIIFWFGLEDKIKQEAIYQDDFIKIILITETERNYLREKIITLTVFVSSIDEAVLEANQYLKDYHLMPHLGTHFTINVFRPGSWINHVIAFKSEIDQLQDETKIKEEQARLLKEQLEQQKRFGRID